MSTRFKKMVVVWLGFFLALLVSVATAAPEREVVQAAYLSTSIEFEQLTAAPGESVQQEVRVPVRWHYADGTSKVGYETATFTLTNEATSLSMLTVTCTASINEGTRFFTGQVKWSYDGYTAFVQQAGYINFAALSPYLVGWYKEDTYPGGPSHVNMQGVFLTTPSSNDKTHLLKWTLPHNSPNCTASGYIITGP